MEYGGPISSDYQYQNQIAWEEQTRLAKALNSCEAERDRLKAEKEELVKALQDTELRATQAKIASTIGKRKDRTEFLREELEHISDQARAAVARETGGVKDESS